MAAQTIANFQAPLGPISFPMGVNNRGKNLDRQFSGDDDDDGGGGGGTGGGGVGPTKISGGANEAVLGNLCRGENFANCTDLQPFDSCSTIPYKSPGVEMATAAGFPFTLDQWKELERQAMIFKYMISSAPVPPHLLFPLSRNLPAPAGKYSISSIYNGRYSGNGDPEPVRCKRTDGKKWRCSRDVAPHQKYCERHLHRGRPRSRKPVEIKNNGENHHKKMRLEQSKSSLPKAQSDSSACQQFVTANEPLLLFDAKTDLSIRTPYQKGTDRDLGLATENEMVGKHLMESNAPLSTNEVFSGYSNTSNTPILINQDYKELNIFSYPNFPAPENNGNFESSLSMNEENFSPSLDLSMAMAAGNVLDDDHGKTTEGSIWSSPLSCESFARGGPLGEALHAPVGSSPASPYGSMATYNVPSPSGVLHRNLFSDGSVCNSPSFGGAPAPPSEVSIQWFN